MFVWERHLSDSGLGGKGRVQQHYCAQSIHYQPIICFVGSLMTTNKQVMVRVPTQQSIRPEGKPHYGNEGME